MFNLLVSTSLKHRLFVLAAALMLVVYGSVVLPRLPVDVLPDLTRPSVTVMAETDGLAPEEVERLVTRPIESLLNGIPGVETVRSTSGIGFSMVVAEFGWATDVTLARIRVNERLGGIQAQLPPGVVPQMASLSSIMGEILLVGLTADAAATSAMELREIADFVLRPQILAVPGVSTVISIGGEVRQYRVTPNAVEMHHLKISSDKILDALRRFGTNSSGGFVDQQSREYLVRNVGLTTSLEDLRNTVVDVRGNQSILLRQVAFVDFAPRIKRGDAGYNGTPAVIVSIQKQPGADTLSLTSQIERLLSDVQKTMPAGVKVDQVQFRQATFIETSIANLQLVLLKAAVVVACVLIVFLVNVRATMVSLTAIPISILFTVVVFQIFGLTINTMTLGGLAIAIGELVDDAVVDVENVLRRLKENARLPQPLPVLQVIAAASQEVRSGIVYATFIIILVFLPLFALSGIEGRLFTPLGIAYIVSILGSLITSITLTPVLCYYLLSKRAARFAERPDSFVVRILKSGTERLLDRAFARPALLFVTVSVGIIVAGAGAAMLPRAFLPAFNEGTILVGMRMQPGISLGESNRIGLIAEKLILEVPDVLSVGRRTGRAEADLHAEGVHAAEIDVNLKPERRPMSEIMADIREKLAVLPASSVLGQPISHRIEHMLSGVRAAVALKIFGEDLDTLGSIAGQLRQQLAGISGLVDLQVERQVRVPQVRIQVDPHLAAMYGVTPQSVIEQLRVMSNGQAVSRILAGDRQFDVVVRLDDGARSIEALRNLLIATANGGFIPIHLVAAVEESDGPNQVLRENGQRRIVVFANVSGGTDMAQVVENVRGIIAATSLPSGYRVVLDGTFRAQEQASWLIGGLSALSIALIFLVLYSRYGSTVLTLIILGNIPLALIGSVVALYIAGLEFSVASMVGFITLAGISARNGILKVSHYINLALLEGERFGRDLVVRGTLERLTPVLMTALSAGLALIPLLFLAGAPGAEILYPVAVTIFGGLISATLLDTFLTPTLFLKYGRAPLERLIKQRETALSPASAY
ncbi:MAG: efflux RND transporter permease subunit [Rhizobiales bacterium]|nr:efflux RND transporter permease subunit [Hyphomicrobiales bacterium]